MSWNWPISDSLPCWLLSLTYDTLVPWYPGQPSTSWQPPPASLASSFTLLTQYYSFESDTFYSFPQFITTWANINFLFILLLLIINSYWQFQNLETGSECMCRSVMASSCQKWYYKMFWLNKILFQVNVKIEMAEEEKKKEQRTNAALVWVSDES